ncbi:MAG: DUF3488 domain-containing protein [Acidobacteria bacterium]|nr:DUF3488 domain-containing protein [Acidobacteriota bacterium]
MSTDTTLRRLAGFSLLWAIVPAPFLGIILPPFWVIAAAAGVFALWSPKPLVLSVREKNLLAIVALVVVLATGGWRIGPLRPLGHLLLLLAAAEVATLDGRRSFRPAMVAAGLFWALAVAASIHVMLVVYLVLSVGVLWWVGMRSFLLLQGVAPEEAKPRLGHIVPTVIAVTILAVPVFFLVPRLRSPWLSAGTARQSITGFSAAVRLSGLGEIQTSRRLAMIVTAPPGSRIDPALARFRATAYDLLKTGLWLPRRSHLGPWTRAGTRLWLVATPTALDAATKLDFELLRPEGYLFLPPGSVAVEAPVRLRLDPAGGVLTPDGARGPLVYHVWVRRGARRTLGAPGRKDLLVPWRRTAFVRLALDITKGAASTVEKARAVVHFLQTRYRYTLNLPRRYSPDPVGDFLFKYRRGHCELFAGSMVILLRSIGVKARMVGGYSGGDLAGGGRVLEVRDQNAHTWVEVWVPHAGWMSFDPTPPADVPAVRSISGLAAVRWVADRVELFWDRNVLTFDIRDQVRALREVLGLASRIERSGVAGMMLVLLALAGLGGWLAARRRNRGVGRTGGIVRGPAARALRGLEPRIRRHGLAAPPGATLRAIGRRAVTCWPDAAAAIERLVTLAEDELYGSGAWREDRARVVRRLRREIRTTGRGGAPARVRPE